MKTAEVSLTISSRYPFDMVAMTANITLVAAEKPRCEAERGNTDDAFTVSTLPGGRSYVPKGKTLRPVASAGGGSLTIRLFVDAFLECVE
jgi:hypothetical protein